MLRSDLHKHLPPIAIELFMDMVASSIKRAQTVDQLLQADHFEAAKLISGQANAELQGLVDALGEMKNQAVAEGEKRKKAEAEIRAAIREEIKPAPAPAAPAQETPASASVPDTQAPTG